MLVLMTIIHVSCKKETGSIGLNAGDAALQPLEIDTFTLQTRTVREDSLRSDGTSYQMMGATRTSEFGLNSAAMSLSFTLPSSSFSFPAGVVIDSIVFQGEYTGPEQYVGNLNTPMNIKVSQVNKRLYLDSTYFSNTPIPSSSPQNFTGVLHKLSDSVYVKENGVVKALAPQMRLKLGQEIVDIFQNASSTDLGSNTAFQDYFNGLKLEAETAGLANGQGNIVYFNFNKLTSGLAVYFNDTGKYVFPVGENGVKVGSFSHDFSGITAIQNQLNDTNGNFDITYIQSMAGLKTRIDIPNLLSLVEAEVYGIVDAKFVFYYDESTTSTEFPAFNRMLLLKRGANNQNNFLADQIINSNFYGGSKQDGGFYEFHITREIQDILNNYRLNGLNLNTGFFLITPSDNPVSASHMQMNMQKGLPTGVKFVVTVVKTK